MPKNKKKFSKKTGHHKFCLTALIMGIISLLIGWVPFFGWAIVIATLVVGVLALHHTNIKEKKNIAFMGMVLAILGLIAVPMVFEATVSTGWFDVDNMLTDRTEFTYPFYGVRPASIDDEGRMTFTLKNKGTEIILTGNIISNGDCKEAEIHKAILIDDDTEKESGEIIFNKTVINTDDNILFEIRCAGRDGLSKSKSSISTGLAIGYKSPKGKKEEFSFGSIRISH